MSAAPLVWHYGLMAHYGSEFLLDAPEVPYFAASIARFGQPVLDLGCGTGRLLLPLLRSGIDVEDATSRQTW
jgi:2-polyprenyl-3-methyl-5-hydroxy-6-metoxy-1,4-benzoquinol methylase